VLRRRRPRRDAAPRRSRGRLIHDDRLPWGGRHVGPDGLAELGLVLATTVDTEVTPETIFEAGDTVIQMGRSHGTVRADGSIYDIPECHVWTFRNGKVVQVEMYIESNAILQLIPR